MAQPLRLDFAGAVWHLTPRGNGEGDDDRLDFAATLAPASWSAVPPRSSTAMTTAQLSELRDRLGEALAILVTLDPSLGVPQYTDPVLASGLTVKADYIQQLRDRVK